MDDFGNSGFLNLVALKARAGMEMWVPPTPGGHLRLLSAASLAPVTTRSPHELRTLVPFLSEGGGVAGSLGHPAPSSRGPGGAAAGEAEAASRADSDAASGVGGTPRPTRLRAHCGGPLGPTPRLLPGTMQPPRGPRGLEKALQAPRPRGGPGPTEPGEAISEARALTLPRAVSGPPAGEAVPLKMKTQAEKVDPEAQPRRHGGRGRGPGAREPQGAGGAAAPGAAQRGPICAEG